MTENNPGNEVATINADIEAASRDALADSLAALARGEQSGMLTWLNINSQEDALAAFDAVTNSVPLADNIGKTINAVNVIFQTVELVNEETGELDASMRTTIIDDKGKAYHATSPVVYRSLRTLFMFVGTPDRWSGPVPLKALKGGTGRRQFIEIRKG